MINRDSNVDELEASLAEVRIRTETLSQQVNAFQPEFSQTLKKLSQDFWKLRFSLEEAMKKLDIDD